MKYKYIIQRLCMFLFALVLAAPAWSKTDTWSAKNRNKNETEGTRQSDDGIVTITWTNCKASGALMSKSRNFEFKTGGTATITCKSGWRVRGISFSDDLKNVGYISCSSDGSLYTGNGSTGISCYDAPKQSITISTTGNCEFVNYTIEYVQESSVEFNRTSYGVNVDQQYATAMQNLVSNPQRLTLSFSIDKTNIAAINYNYFKGVSAGTATLTAKGEASADYAASYATATINVLRLAIHPTASWTSKTMNAWDTLDFPEVQGLPGDHPGNVTWVSLDTTVAKVQNGKIVFGGTGYGKTVKITGLIDKTYKYSDNAVSFSVTVNNEMHIASKTDWEQFRSQITGGNGGINATLTANITDPITASAGSEETPYSGTFEGNNHSIALALNFGGNDYTAPFLAADGATIRNLTVTGSIATSGSYAGSLVGLAQGNAVTIDHCQSSVTITSNRAVFLGGLIGKAGTSVKISNCIFSGSMTGANTSNCGGLVGWIVTNGKVSSITNCLVTAAYSVSSNGSNAVAANAKNATISKVYILNALGDIPTGAEQVNADQLKSGYVAYQLQNGQTAQVWGQQLNVANSDAAPIFSTDAKKRVYTAAFRINKDNSKVLAVRYCNPGQTPAELTQEEILAYINANAPTHYITYQKPSISAIGNADSYIDVQFTDQEYLSIGDAAAWQTFCDYINNVSPKVSARMTGNVTLSSSSPMAGNTQAYTGKFDGGFHTLKVAYVGTAQATAPFTKVAGATIENLKVEGTVEQKGTLQNEYHASGLVGSASDVTFNNCEVAVELIFNQAGQIYSGGFVGHGSAKSVTMNNCKFSGSFTGKAGNIVGVSGFVGWAAKTVSISNSYVGGSYTNVTGVHPLVYSVDNPTVTGDNNYYCFTAAVDNYKSYGNATKKTADEAKSGSVTYALQQGSGAQYWSQRLPGDNEPILAYSGAKTVNKVEFVYNGTVKATRYANTGSAIFGEVPTAKDILGSTYNDVYNYDISFTPDFTDKSVVNSDILVTTGIKLAEALTINSKETWDEFCALVNSGINKLEARMTADITDSVSTMAGTAEHPYQGTFDGQGHTLTLNLNATAEGAAPFSYIDGTTIKGLRTTGTIKTSAKYAGGIVGVVNNSRSTVSDCQSDVTINATLSDDVTHGGIVGLANSQVSIENCAFTGNISGAWIYNCGGILGWAGTAGNTIKNCLVTGTLNVKTSLADENSDPIARNNGNVEISNTYYLNTPHAAFKGEQVNEELLRSGEIAYKLQGSQKTLHWGQQLPNDNVPQLTSDEAKRVRAVRFTYNGTPCDTLYATTGSTVMGKLPGIAKVKALISNYNRNHYYAFAFSPAFSTSTVVNADMGVAVSYTKQDYFPVATGDDWNDFAEYAKGEPSVSARLTADIPSFNMTVIGSGAVPYRGSFDGQGHTLTLNLNSTAEGAAPFSYIDGAVIKGLRTVGTINTSAKYAGGIVGFVNNSRATVSHCQSDVTINSTFVGDATHGGIVGLANSQVSIENCAFNGTISSINSWNCGGIIGWASTSGDTIRNCLVTGKLNVRTSLRGENSDPIARNNGNVEITNTYYLNTPHETSKGEKVTEDQLRNGYVASMLQAGNADASVWAFRLGDGTMLDAFSHPDDNEAAETPNYVYYDSEAKQWRCDDYRLTDGEAYQDSYVEFTADRVAYLRSLSADGRYTWYQPYTLTCGDDLPFKAYKLKEYTGGNAVFRQLENGEFLEAFTPYLIVMNESTERLDFQQEAIVKHYDESNAPSVEAGGMTMTGTLTSLDNAAAAAANAYILQNDGLWHKVTTDNTAATIPAYRAYLTMPASAPAKAIRMVLGDTTTGINGVVNDYSHSGAVYNLQGQKVADSLTDDVRRQLPTGVYIVNGKKVVLK